MSASCLLLKQANRDAIALVRVACAGSVDNSYPASVRIKIPNDPITSNGHISKKEMTVLSRFVVKGNSMQYANINSDDLVYVRSIDIDDLRYNLPKVTLLSFNPKSPDGANHKIRRTWSIVRSNICEEEFDELLDDIIHSHKFKELEFRLFYIIEVQ